MASAATILDMVIEILLPLPLESIFRFRSVSKQWNTLLTSPEFLSHYSRRFHHRQRTRSPHNLLGFFELTTLGPPRMSFLSTQPQIGCENFSSDLGHFITSSNGLVLCGRVNGRSLYILNPVTRKHVSLPRPRKHPFQLSIGLSCRDEDGDDLTPRYEVVVANIHNKWYINNKLCIETYSSETKEWRESVLVATAKFLRISPCPPKVVNGVFYWFLIHGCGACLAGYDPHNKLGGNKDGNHLQVIQLPAYHRYDPLNRHVLNQKPEGSLIFGQTLSGRIEIWELPKGFWRETTIRKQEWVLIYEVPCESCLKSVGLLTWNPLTLMVRQGSSVFQYNMETELMKHMVSIPEWELLDQPFFEATSFSSYLLDGGSPPGRSGRACRFHVFCQALYRRFGLGAYR